MISRDTVLRAARSALVVLAAFAIAGVIYQITGYSLGQVFSGTWEGAVSAPGALDSSLRWAVPLLLIALGVTIAFRAGFLNVGAQGQLYAGAIAALLVGVWVKGLPTPIGIVLVMLAGCIGGAIWSLVPGVLRAYLQADEVITTLMMNFIALLLLQWVASGPLKDPAGSGQADQTRSVADHLRLSDATGISLRIVLLAAVATVAVGVLLNRTQFGLRVRVAGRNPTMARWQGVDARHLAVQAFMLSGLLAGLAGAIELLGPGGQLTYGFSPDVGFIGIVIALVGGLRIGGVVIAALFFGGLHAAILYLPIVTNLPSSALDLLNGLVALLITISAVPAIWHRRRRRAAESSALNTDVPRVEVSAAP